MLNVPNKHCSFIASVLFVAGALPPVEAAKLPDGPGKETVQKICSGCHAAEVVLGKRETKETWEQIVSSMADKGANGTDAEFDAVINYLATHFPKNSDDKPGASDGPKKSR